MYAKAETAKAPFFTPVAIIVRMIPVCIIATPGITAPNGADSSPPTIPLTWIPNLSTVAIPSVSYYWYDVVTNGSSYDYYSTPWERTADWLGGVNRSCGYKKGSLAWGIVENILGPAVIPVYLLFGF